MELINFWALAIGSVAIAAPVAVHLLTKPKPVAFPFSTVRFLNEIIQQRRAKSRLRDWLILLLRTLCIALLALALSRPLLQSPPAVPLAAEDNARRVVVLDVSQSMAAGSGGVTSWTSGVASALQYLDNSSGMQAAVIFAGAKAQPVFDRLSPNLGALREAVKQARPKAERAEPRDALEKAAKILDQAEGGTKELVIISDFQRSSWGTLLLDLIPSDTQVQFHSVAGVDKDNVAITEVRFASEPVVGQLVLLEVDVANHSEREVKVRCRIDLNPLQRTLEATLPPQSVRTLTETVSFDQVGWMSGWAKLESNLDVLPDDDERPIAIRVLPPTRVLLISKQNATEIPSSSFYLQQALSIAFAGQELDSADELDLSDRVKRFHPARDNLRDALACDVFVLDHPGQLSEETLKTLAAQLKRGKGLLYVTSELVDAVNLKQLAEILGGEFQPPVELVPDSKANMRKDLFVRQAKSREAPFSALGSANVVDLLKPVRFHGGLATRATSEGLRDQVLAELSDTSALLYVSGVGAGQIAILNTDLARSNWAVQPTFLPVVSELINALLSGRGRNHCVPSGETLVTILPSTVSDKVSLTPRTVEGPPPADSNYGTWEWVANQGAVVWNWREPPGAGIYSLDDSSGAVWMVATAAPGMEADLNALDKSVLTERVSGTRTIGYASVDADDRESNDIWKWLVVGCLVGLIGEIVALRMNRM